MTSTFPVFSSILCNGPPLTNRKIKIVKSFPGLAVQAVFLLPLSPLQAKEFVRIRILAQNKRFVDQLTVIMFTPLHESEKNK